MIHHRRLRHHLATDYAGGADGVLIDGKGNGQITLAFKCTGGKRLAIQRAGTTSHFINAVTGIRYHREVRTGPAQQGHRRGRHAAVGTRAGGYLEAGHAKFFVILGVVINRVSQVRTAGGRQGAGIVTDGDGAPVFLAVNDAIRSIIDQGNHRFKRVRCAAQIVGLGGQAPQHGSVLFCRRIIATGGRHRGQRIKRHPQHIIQHIAPGVHAVFQRCASIGSKMLTGGAHQQFAQWRNRSGLCALRQERIKITGRDVSTGCFIRVGATAGFDQQRSRHRIRYLHGPGAIRFGNDRARYRVAGFVAGRVHGVKIKRCAPDRALGYRTGYGGFGRRWRRSSSATATTTSTATSNGHRHCQAGNSECSLHV